MLWCGYLGGKDREGKVGRCKACGEGLGVDGECVDDNGWFWR